MKARNTLIALALFALAFVGSLFAMKWATPVAPATAIAASVAPSPRMAAASVPSQEASVAPARPDVAPVAETSAADVMQARPVDGPLPSVQESLSLLNFGTKEDRIRAIQAVAQAARNGSEVARMRRALRLVSADEDPEVAARAQDEYEQLAERDDR